MINDTKREIKRHEHQFAGKHHEIDYLEYEEKKSSHLIVVLSGFNGKEAQGTPARYNYMRTLQDIKINKLFIKDEVDEVPVYYMGTEGTYSYMEDVCALIEQKLSDMNISKEQLIIAGSSKGGTGALLIGLEIGAGHIISAANQLNVGTYLSTMNAKLQDMMFTKMIGHNEPAAKDIADSRFREKLLVDDTNSRIYFHGGNQDTHYRQHMVPLLRHLDDRGILYELDLRGYVGHDNVKYYFPEYFIRKVREIISSTSLERPRIEAKRDATEIEVKVNNPTEHTDWAIYVYRKDGKITKIMYNKDHIHTVPLAYDAIKSVKVFLRVNGEKKRTINYSV
ncbi:hypothetical protein K6L05_00900 [Salinicoccus roseus]|uniref:hypothetical protein n=1 Tax=Salinicoccus roseus TaxID=45670 RepID=UPI001CA6D75E|nr:hypothetical protein [Salinicoccus roseus]MBY8908342.1 hypothetical protein [Salinicoccus roseus]